MKLGAIAVAGQAALPPRKAAWPAGITKAA
jgi:hypothetical protein